MGVVWIFFLISPLLAAWNADASLLWRVIGVLLVVAFAGCYIAAYVHYFRNECYRVDGPRLLVSWLVLVLIGAGAVPVVGPAAMSFLPFVVAFGAFALPLWLATASLLAATAITVIVPLVLGVYDEMWFFTLIVGLVGLTTLIVRVVNSKSEEYEQVKDDLRVLAERERVARDVHDVLGHSLTVLTVKAELAQRLIDVDAEQAKAELAQIQSLTREALAEIRATVAGLRVARLGDELAASREALRSAGIAAEVPEDAEVVDPRHRILLAWSLREATTNVVRHSGARHCRVELDTRGMRVIDDGRGIDGAPEGNGLRGLRERVEQVGGRATLTPGIPTGTVVEVRL
ncbi:sensor histidine kinase [Epidermidibacterium keratini]|uniref:Sensor histidine kinase n=2 Tax=Epidermidibacterium keratini TaxID=1891644 RepID=A0A7L4YTD1_9ACTN|nr:sensor histidine kinase [Epidermidibacterium keratini]